MVPEDHIIIPKIIGHTVSDMTEKFEQILRYCYNATDLYGRLEESTKDVKNVCEILSTTPDCSSIDDIWADGNEYSDGVKVNSGFGRSKTKLLLFYSKKGPGNQS